MPRKARLRSETDYYHVMVRGNNRNWIFSKESKKKEYIHLLKKQVRVGLIELVAWCLMDNHVHLILMADLKDMSLAMKKINWEFAIRNNQNEKKIGHVFQDRFRSEPIGSNEYIIRVIRYVHNNPVKAHMVKSAGDYKWSSYNSYLNLNTVKQSHQIQLALMCFEEMGEHFVNYHLQKDKNKYLD